MKCPKCRKEFSSRPNMNITFCLNCDIWGCQNHPNMGPNLFCSLIPEKPIPLSKRDLVWARKVAEKWANGK